jgi:hypothetical protein
LIDDGMGLGAEDLGGKSVGRIHGGMIPVKGGAGFTGLGGHWP